MYIKVRGSFRLRNVTMEVSTTTIHLIATCFGRTTIFKLKYIY
jgi:hypothetical protein